MRQKWGISTVIMNKRGNPCPKCLPFVGKVLIDDVWSGGKQSDGPYMLMSTAIANGLYHPRCKDSHTTYFPGISSKGAVYTDEEKEQVRKDYEAEQKKTFVHRQAERFGRLALYSLDADNQEMYAVRKEQWENVVANGQKSDILITGARIIDPDSTEGTNFAEMYYKEIRSFSTDIEKIADNLGKDKSDIRKIKEYLFENKSWYNPEAKEYERFKPDCAIAQSWQRLMNGKDIKKHDRTLIEHELLEMKIKEENPGIDHLEAHRLASVKYNYPKR